jgi:hypothetical protein
MRIFQTCLMLHIILINVGLISGPYGGKLNSSYSFKCLPEPQNGT